MNINYTEVALGSEFRLRIQVLFDRIVAQYSADPRTGTISKSTRSSQRRAHSFNDAGVGASMIWKQRAPAASTQLA